ncbi:MAG: tetratricopeptide repeat protein [Smithellaceae bacterium]
MTENSPIPHDLDTADDLLAQGRHAEAIALLLQIASDRPEEEQVLLRLAWALWDHGDRNGSVHYWEILLDRELQRKVFTGFAYDELVRIYKQDSQIEKLVGLCEKVVHVQPQDAGLQEELGNAYLLSGQNEKARDIFSKLISMEKDNPVFYCRMGDALMATGKKVECEDAYCQAGQIDPDEATRYFFLLADLYNRYGDHSAAKRWLEKCLEADGVNSLYLCALGDTLIALQQFQNAIDTYEKAAHCDAARAAVYYNRLGHSFMKAGHFLRAAQAFEKAVVLDAAGPYAAALAGARKALEAGRST